MALQSQPPRRMIGASTKLYFSAKQTSSYIEALAKELQTVPAAVLDRVDVFFIPDHLTLSTSIAQLRSSDYPAHVLVGAQDGFWEDSGPYTGAVSPAVLRELGVHFVEVGHAERRRLFGETDEQVALKAAAAARNGMVPLVCVGETERPVAGTNPQNAALTAVRTVQRQAAVVMEAVESVNDRAEVILAYEPVWAIGAAQPANAEHIVAVAKGLRAADCVQRRKETTRIIYGGSAGPGLFEQLEGAIDGLFLGRFAHDPKQFCRTICEVAET